MLKKWHIKALVQKAISLMPFSFHLNYLFQKYVTKGTVLQKPFFEDVLSHTADAVKRFNNHEGEIENGKLLELGTGWFPIVPVGFFLCGIDETVTIDLRDLLRKENLLSLLDWFLRYEKSGELKKYLPDLLEERVQELKDIIEQEKHLSKEAILAHLRIRHLIVDASNLKIEDGYFDFTISINTLEHVSKKVLPPIMHQFARVSKSDSLHYHQIGAFDHFNNFDKGISKFNYLRYSDFVWHKIIDNNVQPQNRLKHSYFAEVFENEGFEVLELIQTPVELNELEKIKVHPTFDAIPREELAIAFSTFVIRKLAADEQATYALRNSEAAVMS